MPDPVTSSADAELKTHVERVLSATYAVDCEIGRGGMGIVYRAKDLRLKRNVAVKLLPPELAFRPDIRTRFLREAETAAQLSHANIVPIYSVDEREGLVFFVMQYIDGDNLAKRLATRGPLEPEEVRRVLREVADALAFAHARGVVHRDIKPDNILLCKEDNGHARAMVTDFGIAFAVSDGGDSRLTATGVAIGTPTYMAPEQAAGDRDVDGRTDLYSLGVVGYQMLSGEPPFKAGSTPAMLVKHLSEMPVPVQERRPGIPPDLARAVMVLLEKDPAHRFATAQALVSALVDGGPMPAGPNGMGATAARRPSAPASPVPDVTPAGGMSRSLRMGMNLGGHGDLSVPTADELVRWEAQPVVKFRKAFAPYVIMNVVIVLLSMFTGFDGMFITAFWSIWMAWNYAKLWSEGYDWRDVFKQPRDRLFFDVAAETIDDTRALFDQSKRAEVRDRVRRRSRELAGRAGSAGDAGGAGAQRALPPAVAGVPGMASPANAQQTRDPSSGAAAEAIARARADRDEIARILATMPKPERDRVADVLPSADALYDTVRSLAGAFAELERSGTAGAAEAIDREITTLEGEANPLDRSASEERVRRLAYLKRQRRTVAELRTRRERTAGRLESCRIALETMRYDVLRLRTGGESHAHVTLMAERAMALARDVDGAVYVADEMARLQRNSNDDTNARRPGPAGARVGL